MFSPEFFTFLILLKWTESIPESEPEALVVTDIHRIPVRVGTESIIPIIEKEGEMSALENGRSFRVRTSMVILKWRANRRPRRLWITM
jgi:hypothetical protein